MVEPEAEGTFDPRITPARPDLAAESLRGRIRAPRYAAPKTMQVCARIAPLHKGPGRSTALLSELLLGERFDAYEIKRGWVWGQAARDGYTGYVPGDALCLAEAAPNHRVAALRTPLLTAPELKAPVAGFVHHLSQFAAAGAENGYLQIAPEGGWVFAGHCVPMDHHAADWVDAALLYLHAPYVWGGRSSLGLDCSALVQNALQAGGIAAPRDSDMQEQALGRAIAVTSRLDGLRRGDLVFWRGHVGIMLDGRDVLHANAHHMQVAREPLKDAVARIGKSSGPVTAIKRLD